jgi:hypothetical protein
MVKIYVSAVIAAPLEKVWHKVRDFNGLPGWIPAIAASEIVGGGPADRVGAVRVLTLADNGGTIREQLLALDDFGHAMSYAIIESPMPITGYVSHIRLKPVTSGGATFFEWLGEFDVLPSGDVAAMTSLIKDGVYGAGLVRLAEVFGA